MDRRPVEPVRCPRCGTRVDATEEVTLHLTPDQRRKLDRFGDAARRELRLRTVDEAVVEATVRVAMELLLDA